MIRIEQLSLRRGTKLLFEGADLTIHPGQKVGVTGANGCGKSSLLALLLDRLPADSGRVTLPQGWVIAHVAQEMPDLDKSALDYVIDGDRELRTLQQALVVAEEKHDGMHTAEIHSQLDAIDAFTVDARARRLLRGLGFSPGSEEQSVQTFSGGWRMRLNLGQALMCRSDLLLLDEPTNHLDLDAVVWLEGWLRKYAGTAMIIAHDREFLDAVCNRIIHMERDRVNIYDGNYSAFERRRAEQLAVQDAAYRKQQREIAHMRDFVTRFRAKATKARQAQSRLKALSRMTEIAPAHVNDPFHFQFPQPDKVPDPIFSTRDMSCGYDGKAVLSGVDWTLSGGEQYGLLGRNGEGKSTLVKCLAGELAPIGGELIRAKDLRVGYFAQHQLELLNPSQSALEHGFAVTPDLTEQKMRDFMGGFGFSGDHALIPVNTFSGGERARLVLAVIALQRPNLLLLDEPTNHLDLEMRHALSMVLQEYRGAVVLVSHDRSLLRLVCNDFLLIHGGRVTPFDGDLDDYTRWLNEEKRQQPGNQDRDSVNRREERRRRAAQRAGQAPLRKKLRQCEQTIERLNSEKAELETAFADPDLYTREDSQKVTTLTHQRAEITRKLEDSELEWLRLSELLET